MDTQNLAYHLTKHKVGYEAGSFYSNVLKLMITPSDDLYERLAQLMNLVAHADTLNLASLRAHFPAYIFPILQAYYDGDITVHDAFDRLAPFLRIVPWLLPTALPVLWKQIQAYAASGKPL
jgi:hypothetical protein